MGKVHLLIDAINGEMNHHRSDLRYLTPMLKLFFFAQKIVAIVNEFFLAEGSFLSNMKIHYCFLPLRR